MKSLGKNIAALAQKDGTIQDLGMKIGLR